MTPPELELLQEFGNLGFRIVETLSIFVFLYGAPSLLMV